MFKNQLQELAQQRSYDMPSYSGIREGPAHAPRFKAIVTFNKESFESPCFCTTLRQAENAAAHVALDALSKRDSAHSSASRVLDETGFCKNLLQETAQRAGVILPIYSVEKSGPDHSPLFISTVELTGMKFVGDSAKTKKQAEKNAATAAWAYLKQVAIEAMQLAGGSHLSDEQIQASIVNILVRASQKSAGTVERQTLQPSNISISDSYASSVVPKLQSGQVKAHNSSTVTGERALSLLNSPVNNSHISVTPPPNSTRINSRISITPVPNSTKINSRISITPPSNSISSNSGIFITPPSNSSISNNRISVISSSNSPIVNNCNSIKLSSNSVKTNRHNSITRDSYSPKPNSRILLQASSTVATSCTAIIPEEQLNEALVEQQDECSLALVAENANNMTQQGHLSDSPKLTSETLQASHNLAEQMDECSLALVAAGTSNMMLQGHVSDDPKLTNEASASHNTSESSVATGTIMLIGSGKTSQLQPPEGTQMVIIKSETQSHVAYVPINHVRSDGQNLSHVLPTTYIVMNGNGMGTENNSSAVMLRHGNNQHINTSTPYESPASLSTCVRVVQAIPVFSASPSQDQATGHTGAVPLVIDLSKLSL
ncbi:hypothetical protein KP509_36G038200 [Ceratopteris richardii]|uniref:DRBM domain-containing protein n=1 Tax=Ceratopteris richardii TaxID=49495 RepID=A0A8T2QCS2_CERRI|nr:hypothetical protein KP509_36G038200 [Ceratopteris richardii]